jgi:hypothetical protein
MTILPDGYSIDDLWRLGQARAHVEAMGVAARADFQRWFMARAESPLIAREEAETLFHLIQRIALRMPGVEGLPIVILYPTEEIVNEEGRALRMWHGATFGHASEVVVAIAGLVTEDVEGVEGEFAFLRPVAIEDVAPAMDLAALMIMDRGDEA